MPVSSLGLHFIMIIAIFSTIFFPTALAATHFFHYRMVFSTWLY